MQLIQIGRSNENDIVISDASASRMHAQLYFDDDGNATIIDLNSTNGTFVNGKRVIGQQRLFNSDSLKVGDASIHWQQYNRESAKPITAAQSILAPLENAKKGMIFWYIGTAAIVTIALVIVYIMLSGKSGSPELKGRWVEKENRQAWIEFLAQDKYREGLGENVIFKDASYEIKGNNTLLLSRNKITIIRSFELKDKELILGHDSTHTVFVRDE